MSSTWDALQQNLCQGWWAKIKTNTASLSEPRSRNSPKTTQSSSPTSLLVTNLGYLGTTLRRRGSRLSWRIELYCDWRKFWAMSNQCWFFFTLMATCIRNLSHHYRQWMENSIVSFWVYWQKTSSTHVQTIGATTPGPCIMTSPWLRCRLLCGCFLATTNMTVILHLPTHRTSSRDNFSFCWRWNWCSRCNFWQHWRDLAELHDVM